jgi:hypothetical protein
MRRRKTLTTLANMVGTTDPQGLGAQEDVLRHMKLCSISAIHTQPNGAGTPTHDAFEPEEERTERTQRRRVFINQTNLVAGPLSTTTIQTLLSIGDSHPNRVREHY